MNQLAHEKGAGGFAGRTRSRWVFFVSGTLLGFEGITLDACSHCWRPTSHLEANSERCCVL